MKNWIGSTLVAARKVLVLAPIAFLAACSSMGSKLPPAPASASNQAYNYIIGPGDNVNIIVWRNPELSMSVPVGPDGKVSTPLIDGLDAQGKNSADFSRDV